MGSIIWGADDNPIICRECHRLWHEYIKNETEVQSISLVELFSKSNETWKNHFEKWLGRKWKGREKEWRIA